MEKCSEILLKYNTAILNADISLGSLRILDLHKERFFEVLAIIQPEENGIKEIKNQFDQRIGDLNEYKRIQKIMQYIANFLQNIPENIGNQI